MGTNFYIGREDGNPRGIHIGKRSAAGIYCWDCNETLCGTGKAGIHHGNSDKWLDKCPSCGKARTEEGIGESSAGKELGFNRQSGRKTGVKSCSSFTWAIEDPIEFILSLKNSKASKGIEIFDEYDRKISKKDFLKIVLEDCPVRYYEAIGQEFS
jgi:hypothetical protein